MLENNFKTILKEERWSKLTTFTVQCGRDVYIALIALMAAWYSVLTAATAQLALMLRNKSAYFTIKMQSLKFLAIR